MQNLFLNKSQVLRKGQNHSAVMTMVDYNTNSHAV